MSISQYKLKDGTIRYRVRYTRPDGTRTDERGFTSKAAARKREAEITLGDTNRNNKLIRTFADDARARIRNKAAGSAHVYLPALDTHVLPHWGSWKVSDVTRADVQRWVDQGNWSRSVAGRNIAVLNHLLSCAGINPKDGPARHIDKPARPHKEHVYLSRDQLILLADSTRNEQQRLIILTLGTTGLRWGELAGLRIKDFHAEQRLFHVWQSATIVGNELVLGPTKSRRDRWTGVPAFLIDPLVKLTRGRTQVAPLFPGPEGQHLRRPRGRSWFDGTKKRAALADPTFPTQMKLHDLRHTAASLMVQSGAHVKVIQAHLGHSSASITLDVYADLFREDMTGAVDALNALFAGGQDVGTVPK